MILFKEEHDEVNVIHLIIGEETDFQLSMTGNIVVDLTDNIDPNKRNILYINRCESEEDLNSKIAFYQAQHKIDNMISEDHEPTKKDTKPASNEKPGQVPSDLKGTKYGKFVKDIRCPKCSSLGVYVKNGHVGTCDLCRRIDEGLLTKDIPDVPDESERDDIVRDFFRKKTNRQERTDE